jgi:hypothetical protein
MKIQMIPLLEILENTTYQLRDSSQGKNIPELKRVIGDGFELKPITVRWTAGGYLIIDGFQRVEATRQVHGANAMIKARVCKVSHKVAITMAAAANQTHGGQLEKSCREKIAKTLLTEFPKKSNVQIAKLAFFSEGTIRKYRKEMPEAQTETRIGSDGREIALPKKKEPTELTINQSEGVSLAEGSIPIDENASKGIPELENVNKVSSYSPADLCDSESSEKEALSAPDQKKDAPRKFKTPINEVDILLGKFNDAMEHIESVQAFLSAVSNQEVLSAEEKKLVSDLQGIVPQLDIFS